MNENKYKGLLANTLIFALGSIGSKVILFFLVPLYTNVLNTEQYGVAELIFTIGQLILPFISLTIFDALLRFGLLPTVKKEEVLKCSATIFVIGSITMIAFTPLLSFYETVSPWKWYVCIYVITLFASNNTLIYLKVQENNKFYAFVSILQALLLLLFNVVFLIFLKLGIRGYLISTIASTGLSAILAFFLGGMHREITKAKLNNKLLGEMVKYSAPLIVNNVSWWMIHSSDKIMIEWMIGASFLGLYTAASKIPSLLNVIITIFSQAWGLSSIKEYDSSNDRNFYSKVFRSFVVLIFIAFMLITCITKTFMRLYVGDEFYPAWRYVPVLLLSAVFAGFSSFTGALYGALRKSKNVMQTTLVAGIINIMVNYLLIRRIGIMGAAIGTLLSYVVIAFVRMVDIYQYIKIDYSKGLFISLLGISTCQCLAVSLDWHIYLVSFVCIIVSSAICRKEISGLLSFLVRFMRNKKGK